MNTRNDFLILHIVIEKISEKNKQININFVLKMLTKNYALLMMDN